LSSWNVVLPDRSAAPPITQSRESIGVPVARYFIFVGGTLAALLLIADWCLPTPPAMFDKELTIDRSIIRIKSAHKWPERVVLDTRRPTTIPSAVDESPSTQAAWLLPDEAGDQSNLEALARMEPDTPSAAVDHPALRIKRGLERTARSKRAARGPVTRRLAGAEAGVGCCRFGWIDNGQPSENAVSRRHGASSWAMDWPAPTWRN
jgi:hypothetical protein